MGITKRVENPASESVTPRVVPSGEVPGEAGFSASVWGLVWGAVWGQTWGGAATLTEGTPEAPELISTKRVGTSPSQNATKRIDSV